jgi:hypothetical protein
MGRLAVVSRGGGGTAEPNPKATNSGDLALKDITTFPWHIAYWKHWVMATWTKDDLVSSAWDDGKRTWASVGSRTTNTEAPANRGPGVQTATEHLSATLPSTLGGLGMSLNEGGGATNSLPRSSLMMRGKRLSSRSSYKKRIWSRRNSWSDSSSTDSDLVSSTALRWEVTLMMMWSQISNIRRMSIAEGSG